MQKILICCVVLLAVVLALSNVRKAGAEDDCGWPTLVVQPLDDGVLCIGEGY